MKNIITKFSLAISGFILGMAWLIGYSGTSPSIDMIKNAEAGTLPQAQISDQMVCHAGKILTVLNKNYSTKSLTCMKRSTQTNHDYNNLAEIYAEGWIVIDINNANTWLFNK
ncbi:MAG: hypothetical protein KAJ32_08535 [Gammaproteobacteria bacterium]|nr:hypothetical protein [Gammaproteobacteria bacterium]